jgi:hypothetical protein
MSLFCEEFLLARKRLEMAKELVTELLKECSERELRCYLNDGGAMLRGNIVLRWSHGGGDIDEYTLGLLQDHPAIKRQLRAA